LFTPCDFPDDPVAKVIEEICFSTTRIASVSPPGRVTHFVLSVLPGWLAWFRVLTSGEHGQFQSWHGIDYLLLALTGSGPG
jgi:hypothetical protein